VFPATIFDFNGVLVDDELVHRDAFRDVLTPLGVFFSDEQYIERYLGFDDMGAFRAMLVDSGRAPSDREVEDLTRAKRPFYMRRAEARIVIFDGAARVVRERAAHGPVAIVSGALRDEIDFVLHRMGLDDVFAFIISADDTPKCKPDPMGYLLGIEHSLPASVGNPPLRRSSSRIRSPASRLRRERASLAWPLPTLTPKQSSTRPARMGGPGHRVDRRRVDPRPPPSARYARECVGSLSRVFLPYSRRSLGRAHSPIDGT